MNKASCILCNSEIQIVNFTDDPNDRFANEGICETIEIGYGSKFDGTTIKIVLCDKCIEEKFISK